MAGRLQEAVQSLYGMEEILTASPAERTSKLARLRREQPIALLECHRAFHALTILKTDEMAMKRAELAVTKDSLIPNPGKSPGRDALFELFVAATLHAAGLAPSIIPEGPQPTVDMRAALDNFLFAVEVKRVTIGQVEKAIRKACRQIKSGNLPGIIALDLTYELALRYQAGAAIEYDTGLERFLRFANQRAEQVAADASQWVGKNPVFGLLIFAQSVFIDRSTGALHIGNFQICKQLPFGTGGDVARCRHEIGNRVIAAQNILSMRTAEMIS
ncbi:hypothetical protein WJ32_11045 [Burkholderia ubonensis]|uniref:Restriction endonuclease n=1 Tax=Burkholderia ubonensis TaxID=101571 RepID=A0A103RLV1_9BURK|nr:hypothetical protein WJ32_11045 [Burkholderia ubonensis]KVG70093.1 hypothetical protein WJ33_21725 [Burkholderia ubonensis]